MLSEQSLILFDGFGVSAIVRTMCCGGDVVALLADSATAVTRAGRWGRAVLVVWKVSILLLEGMADCELMMAL